MIQTLLWLALASSPAHAENGGPLTTAGAVVRSKEWLVRRAPQREEEFVGDVSYHQGPSVLTADWALLRHALRLWKARGRVKLVQMLKSGDRVEVMGEKAEYSQRVIVLKDGMIEKVECVASPRKAQAQANLTPVSA